MKRTEPEKDFQTEANEHGKSAAERIREEIAAAPDMLEALERAMHTLETIHAEDDISIDADVLAAGRAAIARAKGGAA